jgi:hypothetical protein
MCGVGAFRCPFCLALERRLGCEGTLAAMTARRRRGKARQLQQLGIASVSDCSTAARDTSHQSGLCGPDAPVPPAAAHERRGASARHPCRLAASAAQIAQSQELVVAGSASVPDAPPREMRRRLPLPWPRVARSPRAIARALGMVRGRQGRWVLAGPRAVRRTRWWLFRSIRHRGAKGSCCPPASAAWLG